MNNIEITKDNESDIDIISKIDAAILTSLKNKADMGIIKKDDIISLESDVLDRFFTNGIANRLTTKPSNYNSSLVSTLIDNYLNNPNISFTKHLKDVDKLIENINRLIMLYADKVSIEIGSVQAIMNLSEDNDNSILTFLKNNYDMLSNVSSINKKILDNVITNRDDSVIFPLLTYLHNNYIIGIDESLTRNVVKIQSYNIIEAMDIIINDIMVKRYNLSKSSKNLTKYREMILEAYENNDTERLKISMDSNVRFITNLLNIYSSDSICLLTLIKHFLNRINAVSV